MKKLFAFALVALLIDPVFAAEASVFAADDKLEDGEAAENASVEVAAPRKQIGVWPAFFAICEIPSASQAPDVVGLRLTFPFSTKQESVTGFDIGIWGRAQYFEGFMCSILRNDVKDQLTGFQVGLYNSAVQADLFGAQVGLWNETGSLRGVQAGIINVGGNVQGLQIGLVNRAEELYGFQVGLVNVIRDAEVPFCPFLNIGF
ncbi:MAG: LA_2272 family surface repeat-containing protein [Kiritimatiellia bacterium]